MNMNKLTALLLTAALSTPAAAGWRCEIVKSDDGKSVSGHCGKVTTIKVVVEMKPQAAAATPAPAAALKSDAVAAPGASNATIGKDESGAMIFLK